GLGVRLRPVRSRTLLGCLRFPGRSAAARLADPVRGVAVSGRPCAVHSVRMRALVRILAERMVTRLCIHRRIRVCGMAAGEHSHWFSVEPAWLWLGRLACHPAERGTFWCLRTITAYDPFGCFSCTVLRTETRAYPSDCSFACVHGLVAWRNGAAVVLAHPICTRRSPAH